jgi:uncharacterized protein YfiM (DUF2279 family)
MKRIHLWFAAVFALDKVLHFSVSYFITSVAMIFGIPFGIGISLLAGILKETSDALFFNGWSWGDMFANILGIAAAVLVKVLYFK